MYQLLSFPSSPAPPNRVYAYDNALGYVISNGSFSKLIAPGLRLGWVECAPRLIERFEKAALMYSGGCPNHFMASVMTSIIKMGYLDTHIDNVRRIYEKRCLALCNTLQSELPEGCRFSQPLGGFFIWIHVPLKNGLSTTDILNHLNGSNSIAGISCFPKVSFTPGNMFSSDRSHGTFIRLAFSMYEEEKLTNGAQRLSKILSECMKIK